MIIGVNGRHSTTRQRFTIAHELGHAMLHEGRELHVDEGFRIDLRSRESSTGTNIEEIEANTFAASLLMPTRFLQRDLEAGHIDIEADQQVEALAKSYDVSRSAMSYRLLNLPARWLLA